MRTIMSALLVLSMLVGVSASANAVVCKLTDWIESQPGQHLILSACRTASGFATIAVARRGAEALFHLDKTITFAGSSGVQKEVCRCRYAK